MTFSKLPNIDLISSVCHGDSASCPPNRRRLGGHMSLG